MTGVATAREKLTKKEELDLVEEEMNRTLSNLGIEYSVIWSPDPKSSDRGQIISGQRIIIIYDEDPAQAWDTLAHEVVELKLSKLLKPYHDLLNNLIDFIEKHIYKNKERVIEELVPLLRGLDRSRRRSLDL